MIAIDVLPVPDWGLRCPHCDAPLAGAKEHRCPSCGKAFSVRRLLITHRPIPDIGLVCPVCDYSLTGLLDTRCPECGTRFSVGGLLESQSAFEPSVPAGPGQPSDYYKKRREPMYTGCERPLPDFGLICDACEASLGGAEDDRCPHCGERFDLEAIVPDNEWVDVADFGPRGSPQIARTILYMAEVPFVADNAGLDHLYGGVISVFSRRLRVPREFFFDALRAFAEARAEEESDVPQRADWICPECGEEVPGEFDLCWSCNTPYPDDSEDAD